MRGGGAPFPPGLVVRERVVAQVDLPWRGVLKDGHSSWQRVASASSGGRRQADASGATKKEKCTYDGGPRQGGGSTNKGGENKKDRGTTASDDRGHTPLPNLHDRRTQQPRRQARRARQVDGRLRPARQHGARRSSSKTPRGSGEDPCMGEGHQGHPRTVFPPQQDETSYPSTDYTTSPHEDHLNHLKAEPSEPLATRWQKGERQLREGLSQEIVKTAIQMDKTN